MEVLYFVASDKFQEIEQALLKDDVVSRQSLTFRHASNYGKKEEGTYVKISGSDEALEKAKELIGENGQVVEDKEKETVLKRMTEEEDAAAKGFGSMFE